MQSQLNSERGYYAARHVTACRRRAEAAFRAYRKRRRIRPNGRSSMIATRRSRLLIHFRRAFVRPSAAEHSRPAACVCARVFE